jgi:leucyl-tRNA synthetase
MERRALACEKVQRFIGEREVKKVVAVPGKLVNVVL